MPLHTRMQHLDSCHPLHETFLEPTDSGQLDLNDITIPCDTEQNCGIIVYVDPLDTCLDTDTSNNVGYIPVFANQSDCTSESLGVCQAFHDPSTNSVGLLKSNIFKGSYGAVIIGNKLINVRHENPMVKGIKGRSRVSAWNKGLCDDQCTSLYNLKKAKYDGEEKLSTRILDLASSLARKVTSIDASRGENRKVIKMGSLAGTLLRCSSTDPKTCPFAQELVRNFIMMVKDGMRMKHHGNKFDHSGN